MTFVPTGQEALERAVLQAFAGSMPSDLKEVRDQAIVAEATDREMTGVGFYTTLRCPDDLPPYGEFSGILFDRPLVARVTRDEEACFLIALDRGRLVQLEGWMQVAERWPSDVTEFEVIQEAPQ